MARAKRRSEPTEDQLQQSVAEFLDLALPPQAIWFHTPNGGSRNVIEAAKLKRMGVKRGVPDIYIAYGDETFWVELKTLTGTLSKEQEEFRVHALVLGHRWACVRTMFRLQDVLESWGIPLKVRC